jgi:phosphoserine phosphatase RsbX
MEAMRETTTWGVASRPFAGESESGDRCVVKVFDKGALVAVIDALGHGHDAAHAARVAVATLEQYAHETLEFLFRHCDDLMRGTRGAAISMASFDREHRSMMWLGVGNVTGALVRADPTAHPRVRQLIVQSGVVGHQLPRRLRPREMPVVPGDTLVLATDGVRSDFTESLPAMIDPQPLAERLLHDYATRNDDALVLVFPCSGGTVEKRVSFDRRRASDSRGRGSSRIGVERRISSDRRRTDRSDGWSTRTE